MLQTIDILDAVSKEFKLDEKNKRRLHNISDNLDMFYDFSEEEINQNYIENEIILFYRKQILESFAKILDKDPDVNYKYIGENISQIKRITKEASTVVLNNIKNIDKEGWISRNDFEKAIESSVECH